MFDEIEIYNFHVNVLYLKDKNKPFFLIYKLTNF